MLRIPSTKLRNSKCGQGNFFSFQPFTFGIKNKRLGAKKLFWTMPKSPCTKLEQFFCVWPPTFGAKSRRSKAENSISAMTRTPSIKLRNLKCGQSNFFAFTLLLSTLKIGNQKQINYFEPCPNLHAQNWSNFFVFGLLHLMPKVGGQE